MPLSNAELRRYDSGVLRLPSDKRSEYHQQVDRLVQLLSKSLRDQSNIKISKVVKAGSFAKHTILRQTYEDPVDVDVVFYIRDLDPKQETLESLGTLIYEALIEIYPNKAVDDFEIQRKAATVVFKGSGLSVDIVPVIEDPSRDGYGWQFDIKDGTKLQTCAPCQIKFVRDRKDADKDYRTLVRLAKKWRNRAGLSHLKSFVIELIMAHLLDTCGASESIEKRFRDFLLYIAQSELKERISFPENGTSQPYFSEPVVILDPVCSDNNVASRLTDAEREEIVAAAWDAWETANFASAEGDIDLWKEIFGPRFSTEAAA